MPELDPPVIGPDTSQAGIAGNILRGVGKLFTKGKGKKEDVPPKQDPFETPPPKEEEKPKAKPGSKEAEHQKRPDAEGDTPPPQDTERALDVAEELEAPPPPDFATGSRPEGDKRINLKHFADSPRTQQIIDFMDRAQGRFDDMPARAVVTNKQQIAWSKDVKVIASVLNKPPDKKWHPSETLALGGLVKDASDDLALAVDRFNREAELGVISDEAMVEVLAMEAQMQSLLKLYVGNAAEAGRSVQVYNALAKTNGRMEYFKGLKDIIDQKGGTMTVEERIRAYTDNKGDLEKNIRTMKGTWGERAMKQIFKYRYNSMLSSIRTFGANVNGNMFVTINENLVIKPLSVFVNKAEQGIRKVVPGLQPLNNEQAMVWRELWAADMASIDGFITGVRGFKRIINGEVIPDGKFMNDIGTRYDVNEVPDSIAGKIGTMPVRLLEGTDAIFRSWNYEMHLSRLAQRRANNGYSGDDASKMYQHLMENPTDDMIAEAGEFAKYAVFANDPNMYSKMFGAIAHVGASAQKGWAPFQALVPFVKTPTNIVAYTRNHTVPWASTTFYKDLAGADPIRRAEAIARFTASIGLIYTLRPLWEAGLITGVGHPNPSNRQAAIATKVMPNSVKINGKWVSLNRLDPAGLSIGIIATAFDYMETAPDGQFVGPLLEAAIASTDLMLDRSMLATTSDLLQVVTGRAGIGTKGDVAASLAVIPALVEPGIVRDVRMMMDPIKRDMKADPDLSVGVWQRVEKRFQNAWPILSEKLDPDRDWRGDIRISQGQWYVRGMIPVQINKPMSDLASKALLQFGVYPSQVATTLSLPGVGLDLNLLALDGGAGFAHDKLEEFVGKARSVDLDAIVGSADFKKLWKEVMTDGRIVDPFRYELLQDMIMESLARGRELGKFQFLTWLDGRETVPGPIDSKTGKPTEIPVTEVFNMDDYPEIEAGWIEGKPVKSDIYDRKGKSVLPSQGTVEF